MEEAGSHSPLRQDIVSSKRSSAHDLKHSGAMRPFEESQVRRSKAQDASQVVMKSSRLQNAAGSKSNVFQPNDRDSNRRDTHTPPSARNESVQLYDSKAEIARDLRSFEKNLGPRQEQRFQRQEERRPDEKPQQFRQEERPQHMRHEQRAPYPRQDQRAHFQRQEERPPFPISRPEERPPYPRQEQRPPYTRHQERTAYPRPEQFKESKLVDAPPISRLEPSHSRLQHQSEHQFRRRETSKQSEPYDLPRDPRQPPFAIGQIATRAVRSRNEPPQIRIRSQSRDRPPHGMMPEVGPRPERGGRAGANWQRPDYGSQMGPVPQFYPQRQFQDMRQFQEPRRMFSPPKNGMGMPMERDSWMSRVGGPRDMFGGGRQDYIGGTSRAYGMQGMFPGVFGMPLGMPTNTSRMAQASLPLGSEGRGWGPREGEMGMWGGREGERGMWGGRGYRPRLFSLPKF